jgi:hypothetical protein
MNQIDEQEAQMRSLLETSLFTRSPTDHASRLVVDHNYLPWVRNWQTTPTGFRLGGRLLAEHLIADDWDFDCLIGVIVFLYRHAVELQLKKLRRMARLDLGRPVDKTGDWTHSLSSLWSEVEQLLRECSIPDAWRGDVAYTTIGSRIEELDSLDPRSFAFRYADDSVVLTGDNIIGVGHFSDALDTLLDWLDGVTTGLMERRNTE